MSINIAIKDEAYVFLKSMKVGDSSFSDVILSFKKQRQDQGIMQFFGVLKHVSWEERTKEMEDLRGCFEERLS